VWSDDVWIVDSTPVECGRSRETVKRSELTGLAEYGYCASRSLGACACTWCVCSRDCPSPSLGPERKPTSARRYWTCSMPNRNSSPLPGQTLIGEKNYFGSDFEHQLAEQGIRLLRPTRKGESERPEAELFTPLRQVIESVNETFKGQLNLEQHGTTTRADSPSCAH
jgi:hypothetical protein